MVTSRQRELLRALAAQKDWATPMWLGGRDGSHHSQTLRQLVRRGLAEVKKSHAIYCSVGMTVRQRWDSKRSEWIVTDGHPPARCRCKGSCRYKITRAGRRVLRRAQKAVWESPGLDWT